MYRVRSLGLGRKVKMPRRKSSSFSFSLRMTDRGGGVSQEDPFIFLPFFRSAPEEGLYCKPKYRAKT